MVAFSEHFWGEKHMGFSVLYQSTKGAAGTAKELAEFVKERLSLEEEHSKHLAKSLAKANTAAGGEAVLKPAWALLKNALERRQQSQGRLTAGLGELVKEVEEYAKELGKRQKGLKEAEHPTFEAVNLIQTTTTCLQKAKETYSGRCVEAEKLRRDPSTAAKEQAKADAKAKKAREEYRSYVDKYAEVRAKFTACMERSAGNFQGLETGHLDRMRGLMGKLARAYTETESVGASVAEELAVALEHMDREEVLVDFCRRRGTGTEPPPAIAFEEADLATLLPPALPSQPPPGDATATANANGSAELNAAFTPSVPSLLSLDSPAPAETAPPPPTLLPSVRGGAAEGELLNLGEDVASVASSTSSSNAANAKEGSESLGSGTGSRSKLRLQFGAWSSKKERSSPATTEAPTNASEQPSSGGFFSRKKGKKSTGDLSKFPPPPPSAGSETGASSGQPRVDAEGYTIREDFGPSALPPTARDSDSSSDDDDEDASHRKIQVKIKPIGVTSPSSGRNGSLSDIISSMSSTSSLQPTTATTLPGPLPLPKSRTMDERDPWAPSASGPPRIPMRPSLTGDGRLNATIGGEGGLAWPLAPSLTGSSSRPRPRAHTPTNCFSLGRSDASLASFSRSESLASLGDDLGGSQYFPEAAAKIPVAMALTETVHAKFVGTDVSRGQVRVFGSVHVSFPGSAVPALLSESPPPPLAFTLSNAARLQALIPNKQVLASTSAFASSPRHELAFNAAGLATQLRRLTSAKPGAPFYNLEVLRYEVKAPPPPLLLQLWWKPGEGSADLRIDYQLNPANEFAKALLNPTFSQGLASGRVGSLIAKPEAETTNEGGGLVWRLTTLSSLSEEAKGSLKARISAADGSGSLSPAPTSLSFSVADASLSGAALEVSHEHYRLSLLKRKLVAGKYTVERAQ